MSNGKNEQEHSHHFLCVYFACYCPYVSQDPNRIYGLGWGQDRHLAGLDNLIPVLPSAARTF